MKIEEVGVNLSREQKANRLEPRFVAFMPGGYTSEPQSHQDALREAIANGLDVGFLVEPVPVKVDWSQPVPSVISRKKNR